MAYDGGNPPLSDVINVTVKVLDSNDNEPVFERSVYEVRVSEATPPGTRILTLRATDADLPPPLTSLAAGRPHHHHQQQQLVYGLADQTLAYYGRRAFSIDNRTGDLTVGPDRLDREAVSEYQLIVTAEDAPPGSPELHTVDVTVHVTVDDANDNAPRIVVNTLETADASVASVAENAESGTFVAHVTVSDPDTDSNKLVNCTLGGATDQYRVDDVLKLVPRPLQQVHYLILDRQ